MIDRQGLLHVGDVILEVNGEPVSTPEDLQSIISKAHESVTLRVGPGFDYTHSELNSGQVKSKLQKDAKNGMTFVVSNITVFLTHPILVQSRMIALDKTIIFFVFNSYDCLHFP